jgi:putative nucleotidyltransferase with HDIG domain
MAGTELERLRRRVDRLRVLPTFGGTVGRVVAALDRADGGHGAAAVLISRDQALTAQLLRLANSAFYGRSGRVGSALEALTVLGSVVARSVILGAAVFDQPALRGLWEHSIRAAAAAGAMATRLRLQRPEEVSGAGLLHDLGKVLLFRAAPEAFAVVHARVRARACSFLEAERALLGTDHGEIASWILPRWRLPLRLVDAAVHHHDPGGAGAAPVETFVVHCANSLAHGAGAGDDRVPAIDHAVARRLGLSDIDLDTLLAVGVAAMSGSHRLERSARA